MKCCHRDHNNDGNCDVHASPGVPRLALSEMEARVDALLTEVDALRRLKRPDMPAQTISICERYTSSVMLSAIIRLQGAERMRR